jgi:hypothetical protein
MNIGTTTHRGPFQPRYVGIKPIVLDGIIACTAGVIPEPERGESLERLYEVIDTRLVDLVSVERDGISFDFWMSDDLPELPDPDTITDLGQLDPRIVPNLLASYMAGRPILGAVVITCHDGQGATTALGPIETEVVALWIAEVMGIPAAEAGAMAGAISDPFPPQDVHLN